jgi:hypothetical protein
MLFAIDFTRKRDELILEMFCQFASDSAPWSMILSYSTCRFVTVDELLAGKVSEITSRPL